MGDILNIAISGLAVGCIYAIIALGFVLIYKSTEAVNFAQGDLLMLGAFAGVTFIGFLGLPYILGVIAAALALAVFGYLLEVGVLRRVMGQPELSVVILTIALGYIFRAAAGVIWGYQPLSFATPFTGKVLTLGDAVLSMDKLAVIVGSFVLFAITFGFFRYTRVGIAMQATAQNRLAASFMGIRVGRVFSASWAISAGLAAIAGILFTPIALADVNMGSLGLKAFAAAILGGFGSIPGALLAAIFIGVVEQFAARYLPTGMHEMVAFILLFIVLVVRPGGLFPQTARKKV